MEYTFNNRTSRCSLFSMDPPSIHNAKRKGNVLSILRLALFDLFSHLAQQFGEILRVPRVPFHWSSIFKSRVAIRARRALCEFFKQINREIQIEIIHVPGDEMQLAREPWPKRRPVLIGVVAKIISVVPHVRRDFAIDLARSFVPQLARITVRTDRTVDSLPRVELIAASAFAAEH